MKNIQYFFFLIFLIIKNANQNHYEASLHHYHNGSYPKDREQQMPDGMWRTGNTYTLFVGIQICASVENSAAICFWAYTKNTLAHCICCCTMFIAAVFTVAKIRNQLWCPSSDEWIRKSPHMHNRILLSCKEVQQSRWNCRSSY